MKSLRLVILGILLISVAVLSILGIMSNYIYFTDPLVELLFGSFAGVLGLVSLSLGLSKNKKG